MKNQKTDAQAAKRPEANAARTIARMVWHEQYRAQNPDASDEAIKAAWKDARSAQVKWTMKALRKLGKSGVVTFAEPAVETAEAA